MGKLNEEMIMWRCEVATGNDLTRFRLALVQDFRTPNILKADPAYPYNESSSKEAGESLC